VVAVAAMKRRVYYLYSNGFLIYMDELTTLSQIVVPILAMIIVIELILALTAR
jgi:hypothetical protein